MTKQQATIGIDLGTTFSVMAYIDNDGKPRTISNAEGDLITPSVVLFDDDLIVVGKEAVKAATFEPDKVADFPKRDMGKLDYHREIGGRKIPPQVIQSLIVEKLARDAQSVLLNVDSAVITVPAFFNEPRRKATEEAGRLAGLDVLDIINEPTAAALLFGIENGFITIKSGAEAAERILVYDLGGGTFDVTLMEIQHKRFKTISTGGDVFLGGLDWNKRLIDELAERFIERHRGNDPRKDPRGYQILYREVEDAKRALSVRKKVLVQFEFGGDSLRTEFTRSHFEELTADLVERTMFTTRNVLREGGMDWKDLTRILLVGGSTRMPIIFERLEQESGIQVDQSLSADEAVAHGAAYFAELTKSEHDRPQFQGIEFQNVNSHSLGILAKDRLTKQIRNSVIIPHNTQLPVTRSQRYRLARDGQRRVAIKIVEGGNSSGVGSIPVGKCTLTGIPPNLPAGTAVDVSFSYSSNGLLSVRARINNMEFEKQIQVQREADLSNGEFLTWKDLVTQQ